MDELTNATSELALAAIKSITQNAKVAVDLHSAVYMFHFAQALIKHVSEKDAYNIHVGRRNFAIFHNSMN